MAKKQKINRKTYYDSDYDDDEFDTMKRYEADDLYNEVELIRLLMLRTMDKMNKEKKKMTLQDHFSALHVFSRASGRVANLMLIQQKVFPPLEKLNAVVRQVNEEFSEYIEKLVAKYEDSGELVPDWLEEMQVRAFQNLME